MARVHGDIIVCRRQGVKPRSSHSKFKSILSEDFKFICGYCGKDSKLFKEDYQIDHFIPVDFYEDGKGNYYNLVYSCRQCNRNKWNKWPTQDITKSHDGNVGFVDPVLPEYDLHLKRDKTGKIIPLTNVGKYIIDELKLDVRRTDEVWAIMKLSRNKDKLKSLIEKHQDEPSKEQLLEYYKLTNLLEKYLDEWYSRR